MEEGEVERLLMAEDEERDAAEDGDEDGGGEVERLLMAEAEERDAAEDGEDAGEDEEQDVL